MRTRGIKVGDTIKFTTWTRDGVETCKRKVVAVEPGQRCPIGVRYNGCNPFWLGMKGDKIHSVEKAPKGVK